MDNPVLSALGIAIAVLVAASQAVNVYLFLKIRVGQLESEKRVLDEVASKYMPRESCALEMASQEHRITQLEDRRHARA